jgi:hypothetical protein
MTMIASLPPAQQSRDPHPFVPVQPVIHRIGHPWFQQAMPGDRMRRFPSRDLQNRCTTLANIRTPIMIPIMNQLLLLSFRKFQCS